MDAGEKFKETSLRTQRNEDQKKEEVFMKRKLFCVGLLFVVLLSSLSLAKAASAEYPDKKIRLVVPWPPGGGTDVTARTLAQYTNPHIGNRLYVENVPGAAAGVGTWEVAKAPADGYTLLMYSTSQVIGPNIQKDYPPYDLFDPICIVMLDPLVMTVKSDGPFKTIADLLSYAKLHPGEVTVTTGGVGAVDHLAIEAFMVATGTKFTLVPNKGTAQSITAVLGGHIQVGMSGFSEPFTLIEGNKLKPLVHFGDKRSAYFPDVPSAKELGYNVVTVTFRGMAVRRGTPDEIKKILDTAFRKGAENVEFKNSLQKIRMEPIYIGANEGLAWVKERADFFKRVAAQVGLKPE
jgi:tripartite-type tricarboxylate transporter receptor subunit TctC